MFETVEGVGYDSKDYQGVRTQFTVLRDWALEQGEMSWTVTMSHAVAQYAYMMEILDSLESGAVVLVAVPLSQRKPRVGPLTMPSDGV